MFSQNSDHTIGRDRRGNAAGELKDFLDRSQRSVIYRHVGIQTRSESDNGGCVDGEAPICTDVNNESGEVP